MRRRTATAPAVLTTDMPALPSAPRTTTLIGALAGLLCLALAGSASGATAVLDLDYDLGSPPPASLASQSRLDLYLPEGATATDSRPVVVYVHGGGWRAGDKRNRIADKVNLFTGAGYVFASLNYRLSPATLSATPDPSRIKFPDHPHDVGEAIGWLDRNLASYGGDPERIAVIGHSAGAHLVSLVATDPSYLQAYGVEPWQLVGAVSLDTAAFDVATRIAELRPVGRLLYLNAFGTAAENGATDSWAKASPITWADRRRSRAAPGHPGRQPSPRAGEPANGGRARPGPRGCLSRPLRPRRNQ